MANISQPSFATAPPAIAGIDGLVVAGRGGFGTVYQGYQVEFHRTVAVKVLDSAPHDAESGRRFRSEVAAMGSVSHHPNVVPVYATGSTADGRPYLVMPYLPGGSLAARIEQGPLPWPEVVPVGTKVASALAAAHAAGILHRDVKPANILFSTYGEPQLADFGIARVADSTRTATGLVTATVTYAPPEILSGETAQPASDVYSLAATLHAALTGRPQFGVSSGEPLAATVARIVTEPTPDLRPAGIPDALAGVIERAMTKDPGRRTATAEQFGAELADAAAAIAAMGTATPSPVKTRRRGTFAPMPLGETTAVVEASPPPPVEHDRPPGDGGSGRRPGMILALAVLFAVVAGAAFLGGRALLETNDDPAAGARTTFPSTPSTAPSETQSTIETTVSPPPTTSATTPSSTVETTTTTTNLPSTTATPATTVPDAGAPGAATVVGTATGYYGLVNAKSLDESFQWLTPEFQASSGGLERYKRFWNRFASVGVSDVRQTSETSATMTVRYGNQAEAVTLEFRRDPDTGRFLVADGPGGPD